MTTTSNPNAIATERQQLVEVAGWPGYFANKTGGAINAESEDAWDGGNLEPENLGGPATTENITVSRPYRPAVHGPIKKAWSAQVGRLRTTVSVWDTDPDLGPIGTPDVYADALLVGLTPPAANAASGTASTIELVFKVRRPA